MVDEVTWLSPKIVREFTKELFQPAGHLGKTMDTKAYLMFVEQPWRRFVLGLLIANRIFASTFMIAQMVPYPSNSTFMNTLIVSCKFSLHWLLALAIVLASICQLVFPPHLPHVVATYTS